MNIELLEKVEDIHSTEGEDFPFTDNRDPFETWIWVNSTTHYRVYRDQLFSSEQFENELKQFNLTSEELEENFKENNPEE
jgi:hypothetical protein